MSGRRGSPKAAGPTAGRRGEVPMARVLALPSCACAPPPLAGILVLRPSDSEKTPSPRHLDLAAAEREGRWSRRQREKQVGEAMEQRRWLGCAAVAG